jgi:predicted kinase
MNCLPPTLHLLAGLPGSGKTTHARGLERIGVVRVSIDEQMIAQHGRLGVDYDFKDHDTLLVPAVEWAKARIQEILNGGASVTLDHGLGTRGEREEFKQLATSARANWSLISFVAGVPELLRRLDERERREPHKSMPITPEILSYLASVYEPPSNEGEQIFSGDRSSDPHVAKPNESRRTAPPSAISRGS